MQLSCLPDFQTAIQLSSQIPVQGGPSAKVPFSKEPEKGEGEGQGQDDVSKQNLAFQLLLSIVCTCKYDSILNLW